MANLYEGWEATFLRSPTAEVTAGTPVTPTTAFGVCKNVNLRDSASIEQEHGLGTPMPLTLEEGLIECGGSTEFLPTKPSELLIAKRDPSTFRLGNYTLFGGAGPGRYHTGAKINQVRFMLDAGGRLRCNMDWFALGAVDHASIAAVIPTDETFNWIKACTNFNTEIASLELSISHNLVRRPVICNAATVYPVTGQKRTAYAIKEGTQSVTLTARFFERPSYSNLGDVVTAFSEFDLNCIGLVGGSPQDFTIMALDGKLNNKEFNASENAEAGWPLEWIFMDWDVVDNTTP